MFRQFQFLLASSRTTVITGNKNIDPKGPGPLNLNFTNQFKFARYNIISMAPNLNGLSTIIFNWAPNNNIDPGARATSI